ncbi:GTP-binding protein 1 [Coniophora puteana RWD-64-598 SS2]|uniref:GTP-binding protein 1 n=1 Tax=Coniophora puteana (strain RWD-64-598) TaxID=741705 RepID=A0A5M3MVF3_CONPW|nr:GTP-binding protein 1 [Coniophora puteana RWD-64-598 SS2]EIW83148.1 GTP-binding protein 1 [Coniophora puteana RWD-64-598 SS2]
MTTLRNFQNEIDAIHTRELAKQRGQVASAPATKEQPATSKGQEVLKGQEVHNDESKPQPNTDQSELSEEEEAAQILELLSAGNHDDARDAVAALLTRHQGELIFHIGSRPNHAKLYASETLSNDDWTGATRTEEQVRSLEDGLRRILEEIGGKTCVLFKGGADHPRSTILLRIPPLDVAHTPEVRCAVVGNVDSGKSTTLGVLTRGALDDGRGRARVGLFRHKHEAETGRTSSVGMEILGFTTSGVPILPNASNTSDVDAIRREKLSWDEISKQAAKIVSFIDLAGHERYLKTTLYGLTSGAPSCVVLMVGANAGLIGMSKEHLAIALALNVPVVVCVTKIDMTPANVLTETVGQVTKILKSPGCRKAPVFVKSMETAIEISQTFAAQRQCPIFSISNVTGEGLDFVRTFLNLLPPSEAEYQKSAIDQPLEYSITEVWSVPYVGTVVNGILNSGRVKTGDTIMFGPDANGHYQTSVIRSMQRKRADVMTAQAGQCVALALKRVKRQAVRKGMIIVHKSETPPKVVRQFEGQVLILYHNTTLQRNYQAMLHCGAVRQTVRIISMDHPHGILRTGDRATVQFEFISHPEFVKVGMKLLFREGKTKGLGVITRLL